MEQGVTQERKKISNELLDTMLEGVKTQDDLWGNSRNGYGKKKVRGNFGEIELNTPRDRRSTL